MFDNLLNDWNIKYNKVKAIIVATEQELLLTALKFRGFVLIPCLIYTLQVNILLTKYYVIVNIT